MATIPSSIEPIFTPIKDELLWLHAYWKLFNQLYLSGQDRLNLLHASGGNVFRVAFDAMRDSMYIRIGRVTDSERTGPKENLSLRRLARELSLHNPSLASKLAPQLDEILDRAAPFRDWRNRRIAHSDFLTALGSHPEPLPGISKSAIDDVLSSARAYVNDIEKHYTDSTTLFDWVEISGDGEQLAAALLRGEQHLKCERRDFEERWKVKLPE